jgi:hypothetical protein
MIPHDEAMAHVRQVIKEAAARSKPTMAEGKKLDPRVSEFETEEQAESYDRWFREKVQHALDNPGKLTPHAEAMARVRETIKRVAKKKSA